MIQFSLQKGNYKKGNHIRLQNSSLLFDNLSVVLEFMKSHSAEELKTKLNNAVEVVPFQDGRIFILNHIGRNWRITEEDIKCILINYVKEEEIDKWIEEVLEHNPTYIRSLVQFLSLTPFGQYIKEVGTEEVGFELIADLDNAILLINYKNVEKLSISFEDIYTKSNETLLYNLYQSYLTMPLSS